MWRVTTNFIIKICSEYNGNHIPLKSFYFIFILFQYFNREFKMFIALTQKLSMSAWFDISSWKCIRFPGISSIIYSKFGIG